MEPPLYCEWLLTAPSPNTPWPETLLQARAAHAAVRLNRYHPQDATNSSARIYSVEVTRSNLLVSYMTLAMLERSALAAALLSSQTPRIADWTALELLRNVAAPLQYVLLQDHTTHSAI